MVLLLLPTSLLEMKVMKTSSLTVVVATLGPGASNSELPNFFQFWKKKKHTNQVPYFSQSPVEEKCTEDEIPVQTFLLATALEAFLVSILKVRTI